MRIDVIEDLMLQVAEGGDRQALKQLKEILQEKAEDAVSQWPLEVRERWYAVIEMTLEAMAGIVAREEFELLGELARLGYDSSALRDRMGEWARKHFSSYPDPGGLLFALGIHRTDISARQVPLRCRMFESLQEGNLCCHPHHGRGSITEVDGLANEVRVMFKRTMNFRLSGFLDIFHLIHNDSLLAKLIKGWRQWLDVERQDRVKVRRELEQSFMPPLKSLDSLRCCLIPDVVKERQFDVFFGQTSGSAGEGDQMSERVADRPLREIRSLEELKVVLETIQETALEPADQEHIKDLLEISAPRSDQASFFAEVLLQLCYLTVDQQWLEEWVRRHGRKAVCWQDADLFFRITDALPAKRLAAWFELTAAGVGLHVLAEQALMLPLKCLMQANRVLTRVAGDKRFFTNKVRGALASGSISADLVVWLWQNGREEERTVIQDPVLVFKTLSIPVRGSRLKANRQLRVLLISNEDFQRFLMRNGDDKAVRRVVSCVHSHGEALDAGEKQSLLVRFARLFPQARRIIEKRTMGRNAENNMETARAVTSIRSYEARRSELQLIVREKIPANSRAIAHARSYGDLRENAEYKAAKDEQSYLLSRREELEHSLKRVNPTDFSNVEKPSKVIPGTTVRLHYPEERQIREFHILGCWDSDPYRNLIAYETPLGAALLGKVPGDKVETPMGQALVESISPLPEQLRRELSNP